MAADLLVFSIAMWWLRVVVGWTLLEVVLVRCVSSRSGCVSMSCGSYRTNVTNPSGLSAHLKRLLELSRLVTVVGSNDSREQGLDRSACDLPVGASTRLPGPRRPVDGPLVGNGRNVSPAVVNVCLWLLQPNRRLWPTYAWRRIAI